MPIDMKVKKYYVVKSISGHCGGGCAERMKDTYKSAVDAIKATKDAQQSESDKHVTYWFDWDWKQA